MKKKTVLFTALIAVLLTSCGVVQQKWCPSRDPHFFYRQQGLKTPKAVLLNQRGYSRPNKGRY